MHEHLDPIVKADQSAQYVDDNGNAANSTPYLTRNIRAVFKCICQAGLKLTIEKCRFGVRQVELFDRTISPERISPQARNSNLSRQTQLPHFKKGITALLSVCELLQKFIPRMAERLNTYCKLLKSETPIKITPDLKRNISFSKQSSRQ